MRMILLALSLLPGLAGASMATNQVVRAGARSLGLGEAGAGVLSGAESMYWNPAGLKGEGTGDLVAGHTSWGVLGLTSESLAESMAIGEKGAFGIAGQMDMLGGLETRDASGYITGETSYSMAALKLGYAHEISRGFSLGASGGFSSEDLAGYSKMGFGGEGGLQGHWGGFLLGLSGGLYPGGGSTAQASLGLVNAVGGGKLLIAGGAIIEGADSRAGLGVEHDLGQLALRAGYQMPLGTVKTQGLSNLSAGLSVRLQSMSVDYAFLPLGDLGQVHRVQLGYRFGKRAGNGQVNGAPSEPESSFDSAPDSAPEKKKTTTKKR